LFAFAGGILISACAIYCHRWSNRLIEERRYLAVWVGVPILLVAALLVIPAITMLLAKYFIPEPYYDGNPPGPCCDGDITVVFVLLLWPFSALVALICVFAAVARSLAKSPAQPDRRR
jgi:MFS family permease